MPALKPLRFAFAFCATVALILAGGPAFAHAKLLSEAPPAEDASAPAATTQPSPMCTPLSTTTLAPRCTSLPMRAGSSPRSPRNDVRPPASGSTVSTASALGCQLQVDGRYWNAEALIHDVGWLIAPSRQPGPISPYRPTSADWTSTMAS